MPDRPIIGSRLPSGERAFKRFANKDPHRNIPFVECDPPSAGVTYWMVCVIVIGLLGALLFIWP